MSVSVPFEQLSPAAQLAVLESGGIPANAIAQKQLELDGQQEQPVAAGGPPAAAGDGRQTAPQPPDPNNPPGQ